MDADQAQKMLEQIRNSYLVEMPVKCDDIENLILSLTSNFSDSYAEVYRLVHSMKGSAGTHGLAMVSAICHELEDNLAKLDESGKDVNGTEINIMLRLVDLVRRARGIALKNTSDFSETERELEAIRKESLQDEYPVLLVESSGYVKLMCQQALSSLPVQLTIEEDGLLALQRLLNKRFACVITANETKTLNGIAMISAIRNSESRNKNIKTILLTSREDLRDGKHLQVDYVINRNASLSDNLVHAFNDILANLG